MCENSELKEEIAELSECVHCLERAFLSYKEADTHYYHSMEHILKGSLISSITVFVLLLLIL